MAVWSIIRIVSPAVLTIIIIIYYRLVARRTLVTSVHGYVDVLVALVGVLV